MTSQMTRKAFVLTISAGLFIVPATPGGASENGGDRPEKVEEEYVDEGAGGMPERKPEKVSHSAVGAVVKVSSTHRGEPGEGPPENLVDGDLSTRWSSGYSAPQEVVLDLGKPDRIRGVKLHWEKASATKYEMSGSMDGKEWNSMHLMYMRTGREPEERVDKIDTGGAPARYLRLKLLGCVNTNWGFSLYEIEVHAAKKAAKADSGK